MTALTELVSVSGPKDVLRARSRAYGSVAKDVLTVDLLPSGLPRLKFNAQMPQMLTAKVTALTKVGNDIDVKVQVTDVNGNNISGAKVVCLTALATTAANGDITGPAVIAAAGTLDVTLNTGPNLVWGTTNSQGLLTFKVTDAAAEKVGLKVEVTGGLPVCTELQF